MQTSLINFCKNHTNIKSQSKNNIEDHNVYKRQEDQANITPAPKFKNKGIIAGILAYLLGTKVFAIPNLIAFKKLGKLNHLPDKENATLAKAAKESIEQSNLKDSGLKILTMAEVPTRTLNNSIRYTSEDAAAYEALKKAVNDVPIMKFYKKILNQKQYNSCIESAVGQFALPIKKGANAFFAHNANAIITPDKSFQASVFHEMGHAIDFHSGGIMKGLYKMRTSSLLAVVPALILGVSLSNKRKVKDKTSKDDKPVQKIMDFIKKNAGKLTILALGARFSSEISANIKGDKIAKNLLKEGKITENLFKKVHNIHKTSTATYALAAGAIFAAIKTAISVKDKVQTRYEEKQILKTT